MIYLETGSTDPYYNLAFEEIVLSKRLNNDYLILWQNDKTVVIGQNQIAAAEINLAFIDQHGIRVVRRCTGGGAVYHDLGNLNYSFISDVGKADELIKERFSSRIVTALQKLGLDATVSGRNDILISGKKVSGTAQRILDKRILYHGTLLFDSDVDMVTGALQVDPSKFQSKGIQSVRSRVGNIREYLKEDMSLSDFWMYLKKELLQDCTPSETLSAEELSAVEELQRSKYCTRNWTFGLSPKYEFSNKQKWPGGLLEVHLSVEAEQIGEIAFYGDFLSSLPLYPLEQALKGCYFTPEAVTAILDHFSLPRYFGEITQDEVVETIFQFLR